MFKYFKNLKEKRFKKEFEKYSSMSELQREFYRFDKYTDFLHKIAYFIEGIYMLPVWFLLCFLIILIKYHIF